MIRNPQIYNRYTTTTMVSTIISELKRAFAKHQEAVATFHPIIFYYGDSPPGSLSLLWVPGVLPSMIVSVPSWKKNTISHTR